MREIYLWSSLVLHSIFSNFLIEAMALSSGVDLLAMCLTSDAKSTSTLSSLSSSVIV